MTAIDAVDGATRWHRNAVALKQQFKEVRPLAMVRKKVLMMT